MQMFPFTAARLKSDIQRAAFTDVGMHTPTHWQRVVVSIQTLFRRTPVPQCQWRLPMTLQMHSFGDGQAPDIIRCQRHVL